MSELAAAFLVIIALHASTNRIVNAINEPQPPYIGVCNDSSPNGETRYCVFKDSPNYEVKRAVYQDAPVITKQSNYSF